MACDKWVLPEAGRADEQGAAGLADEATGGQLVDVLPRDLGVKIPIEVGQGLGVHEAGGAAAGGEPALGAQVEFVLQDERQKLGVREPAGGGFLQAHVERGRQAGKPQLLEGQCELRIRHQGEGIW